MRSASTTRITSTAGIVSAAVLPFTDVPGGELYARCGLEACKVIGSVLCVICAEGCIPIIMLSARGEEYDRINGFELGIDDYVVKPFSPKELMLRMNAIMKRVSRGAEVATPKKQNTVYNLVNNAINYTGESKKVVVSQTVDADRVKISVSDRGPGIAPEDLPYIWDRYYKVDKIHKRAQIGTGLGLSIVKGILEAHSTSYGVESKMGEGSVFWFDMEAIDNNN